jgi:transposase
VIGIDDFAWRRNHRYGTIVCDLERRSTLTLLPDIEPATSEAWLRHHPLISIAARDRGGGYGEAAARALPDVQQVADGWHLMENTSRAFLDTVRKSMRQFPLVVGATVINPELLTSAERLLYEGYLRREETHALVMALFKDAIPITRMVKRTGLSRDTVRSIVRGQRSDVFRSRQSSLDD